MLSALFAYGMATSDLPSATTKIEASSSDLASLYPYSWIIDFYFSQVNDNIQTYSIIISNSAIYTYL